MLSRALAECVGLWLAEGNNKCNNEITFTNSSRKLIRHFNKTVAPLFPNKAIRVYCYSKRGHVWRPIHANVVRQYVDVRARQPYYIWRLASVDAMYHWKNLVQEYLRNRLFAADILRGFFAGEGNIKTGAHNNRTLRIAQKIQKPFIDTLLNTMGLSYRFAVRERAYVITGKWNWNIFNTYGLAELHPLKNAKFKKVYASFSEEHYPAHYVSQQILAALKEPHTARQLSQRLSRSQARIAEVLGSLKKEGIVRSFRVRSRDFWTLASENITILSSVKERYLNILSGKPHTTSEIARRVSVDYKCAQRRLQELTKLKLVTRDDAKRWHRVPTTSNIIIL